MTSNLPDRLPGAGMPAGPGGLARRTAELARQDQPVTLWQRALARDANPSVLFADDAVTLGDERIDIATGQSTPLRSPALDGVFRGDRICHGVLVCLRRAADGRMQFAGADPRSGQVLWRHEPMLESQYEGSPWRHLMLRDHHDPDVLIAHGLSYYGQQIELIDWRTGRSAWAVPWLGRAWPSAGDAPEYFYDDHGEFRQLPGSQDAGAPGIARADRRVRVAVAVQRSFTASYTVGLAGVDEADGTIVWRIRNPQTHPRNGYRWGPTAYLGGTGPYLVLVGAVGTQQLPLLSGGCTCPGGGPPAPGKPNNCAACGGIFRPWAMVAVHDRLSGRRLWSHHWPDYEAPHTGLGQVADIRGGVALTREGQFLRARRIEDGQLLWSTVPALHHKRFVWPGHHPTSQWAWLSRPAHGDGGYRPPLAGEQFFHARTGRTLTIDWVLDQTSDDLVLTHADGMLTCLALPGSPVLRHSPTVAAQPDRTLD